MAGGIPRASHDKEEYAKTMHSIQMILNKKINTLEEKISSLTKRVLELESQMKRVES